MSDSKATGWDKIDSALQHRLIRLASLKEHQLSPDEDVWSYMLRHMHRTGLHYRLSFLIEIDEDVEWSTEDTIDLVVISKIGNVYAATGTISTLQCLADDPAVLRVDA